MPEQFTQEEIQKIEGLEKEISDLKEDLTSLVRDILKLQDDMRKHAHTGIDQTKKLDNLYVIRFTVPGLLAATATNYSVIDNIPFPIEIIAIYESHTTAGSDAGAVSLNIEKLTGTQALDAGTVLLSTAFNLKGTANTVNTGALTSTRPDLKLLQGHRLALKDSGTLTDVAGVCITIYALKL